MPQLLATIFLVALLIYAIPLAIIAVVITGLIFRTKETVGLLVIGGIITGFTAHPLIGCGLLAAVLIYLFVKNGREGVKEREALAIDDPEQE